MGVTKRTLRQTEIVVLGSRWMHTQLGIREGFMEEMAGELAVVREVEFYELENTKWNSN